MQGTTAIITGASSGIGAAFARELARRGVNLVLGARRLGHLEALAAELRQQHDVRVDCVKVNLTRSEDAARLFERATLDSRPVHMLVNNAGIGVYGPFLDGALTRQLDTIDLNCRAVTALTGLCVPHMLEHGQPSYVVNVASIAAYQSTPGFAVYSGTKAYVRQFSEALRHELRHTNVSVTCLCPGGTYTEFTEQAGQALTKNGHRVMMPAARVAKIGVDAALARKRVVIPGFLNWLGCFLQRLLPGGVTVPMAALTMATTVTPKARPSELESDGEHRAS